MRTRTWTVGTRKKLLLAPEWGALPTSSSTVRATFPVGRG